MPRGPRNDAPGAAHHVMVRGIERRAIFHDDADREDLLRRLSRLIPGLGFRCFAWALLPNHLHLVLQSGPTRVSQLMARLGTGYAGYFNHRYDRAGHVFQNRFRSRLVHDDADLAGLVLYVCRNPLEAGLTADAAALEGFPWCSVSALVGGRAGLPFEAISETLALFDSSPARARDRLRERLDAPGGVAEQPVTPASASSRSDERSPVRDIGQLVREVCARFGIAEGELRSPRRAERLVAARALVARQAAVELGCSGAAIARALGVTRAAVSKILARERPGPDTRKLTS